MGNYNFLLCYCRPIVIALILCAGRPAFGADDKPEVPENKPEVSENKPEVSENTANIATPPTPAPAESPTEAQQALRAYLQLQEQLHQTLLTIEQSRKDTEAAAKQNAETIATRLKLIEQALTVQREREADAARKSSQFALIVAACLGGIGLLVMLFTAWFLMRTARQFSDLAIASQGALSHTAPAGLLSDGLSMRGEAGDFSGGKLLGAIERLEKRIYEIEHPALVPHPAGETATGDHRAGNGKPEDPKTAQVASLLGKGESLLHLDQPENALESFDEVLAIDPMNTEALVKKGAALEKLKRLEDAVQCYDRAIAVDDSMTLAYLYKGGVYNQLERFGEALQCYEKALRTQQKIAVN